MLIPAEDRREPRIQPRAVPGRDGEVTRDAPVPRSQGGGDLLAGRMSNDRELGRCARSGAHLTPRPQRPGERRVPAAIPRRWVLFPVTAPELLRQLCGTVIPASRRQGPPLRMVTKAPSHQYQTQQAHQRWHAYADEVPR